MRVIRNLYNIMKPDDQDIIAKIILKLEIYNMVRTNNFMNY